MVPGLVAPRPVFIALFFNLSGASMWVSSLVAAVLGHRLTVAPWACSHRAVPHRLPRRRWWALNVLAVTGSVSACRIAGAASTPPATAPTFALLALGPLIAAGLAFAVPETGGRELEEINQEWPSQP